MIDRRLARRCAQVLVLAVVVPACADRDGSRGRFDAGPGADGGSGVTSGWRALAAGDNHTCAVRATGEVFCWGRNTYGQLGDGTTITSSVPVAVEGMVDAVEIAAGGSHTCALRRTGSVACWGINHHGELGNGLEFEMPLQSATPSTVLELADAVTIDLHGNYACAVRTTGEVACWGHHMVAGPGTFSSSPEAMHGAADVDRVGLGFEYQCVLGTDGATSCRGENLYGELGNGTTDASPSLVEVMGPADATELTVGHRHACVLQSSGRVACWGHNDDGVVGDGTLEDRLVPTEVVGLSGATAIAAGIQHTCAIIDGGRVVCWGANIDGSLGTGGDELMSAVPVDVVGLEDVDALAIGHAFTCAIRRAGTIACWGTNDDGQLGDGTTTNRATPTNVVDPGAPGS